MTSPPHKPNPYAPPETASKAGQEVAHDSRASRAWVLLIFVVHLIAIGITWAFVQEDMGSYQTKVLTSSIGAPVAGASLFALPLCPVAMDVALTKLRRSTWTKISIVAAEVLLTLFHMWVTLVLFTWRLAP